MSLNTEQKYAMDLIMSGKNVLITAQAGTGKTYIIQMLPSFLKKKRVAYTSMTGISASYIGGTTIHSWSGLGLYDHTKKPEFYVNKIKNNWRVSKRIYNTDVLLVDEVSMMPYSMISTLDTILKVIKCNSRPFGGIQLVLLGDWCQLPPINYEDDKHKYAFQNPIWDTIFTKENTVVLKHIMRQDNKEFQNILNGIRIGKLEKSDIEVLASRLVKDVPNNITRLFPIKKDIDTLNKVKLDELDGDEYSYNAKLCVKINSMDISFPKDSLIAEKLVLKIGALVMFNRNIYLDSENKNFIPNGRTGTVIGFTNDKMPIVKYTDNNGQEKKYICSNVTWDFELYSICQLPLILGWNISIHKSQGMTLDAVAIDVGSNIFEYGQFYVAISRCRTLEGLYLLNFDPKKILCDPTVINYYDKISS
jgi:ATP-dependent exoDNAse (exonuclease V) alpha subunit